MPLFAYSAVFIGFIQILPGIGQIFLDKATAAAFKLATSSSGYIRTAMSKTLIKSSPPLG